ncbi:signal recognition particle-docking protein FtsY [Ruminococcus sp. CAG:488]|nr:signal recognition particle-docking protein FtsY [Ruminococcus sp. CAG:488]
MAFGIFKKFNLGLKKTRETMSGAIDAAISENEDITDQLYDDLEEILIMGDVGMNTSAEICEKLREYVAKHHLKKSSQVKGAIKEIVSEMLEGGEDMGLVTMPSIILVIGVNGVGKTTTIGKMAAMYKAQGKKVILGAADTFRAAAIDQLEEWANRAGVDIVKHHEGADPAAVVFDTIQAGIARDADIIICDTAGRLHNKKNLMDELAKIYRIIDKELPYNDRESLLVLDATTGQNAVNQARDFKNVCEITGIVLTKLDGTAKGGVVLAIKNDLKVPVKFVGVGEKIDDLQPFNPKAFADGLFDNEVKHDEENMFMDTESEEKPAEEKRNEASDCDT